VSRCRPATTHVYNTRGCKYSLDAPDDERKYRSKHVEQPRNNKLSYTVDLVGYFRKLNCGNERSYLFERFEVMVGKKDALDWHLDSVFVLTVYQ